MKFVLSQVKSVKLTKVLQNAFKIVDGPNQKCDLQGVLENVLIKDRRPFESEHLFSEIRFRDSRFE